MGTSPRQLVNPRERFLYAIILLVSLLVYGGLVFAALSDPKVGATVVFYGIVFSLLGIFAHGLALGRIRGNRFACPSDSFRCFIGSPPHMRGDWASPGCLTSM